MSGTTIHASAVLVGAKAVLIQGRSGSGKSSLVWAILRAAEQGNLPFARLIGDDRVFLDAHNGQLVVRPEPALAGLLEVRGAGIRRLPYEPSAVVGLNVALAAAEAERLPTEQTQAVVLHGISIPNLALPEGADPLPAVLAALSSPLGTGLSGN